MSDRTESILREIIIEMILLEGRRRRPRPQPWPNLTTMQAARRMATVKRRRGRLIRNQLRSFRWADKPERALRDLKLRAKGG